MGGASKKLLENIDSCVTFSPDGQRFAFVRRYYAKNETSLMIANADGIVERTLVTRKYPNMFVSDEVVRIAWSPDGKIVACPVQVSVGAAKVPDYSVVGVSVEDRSEKALTSHRWDLARQVA